MHNNSNRRICFLWIPRTSDKKGRNKKIKRRKKTKKRKKTGNYCCCSGSEWSQKLFHSLLLTLNAFSFLAFLFRKHIWVKLRFFLFRGTFGSGITQKNWMNEWKKKRKNVQMTWHNAPLCYFGVGQGYSKSILFLLFFFCTSLLDLLT